MKRLFSIAEGSRTDRVEAVRETARHWPHSVTFQTYPPEDFRLLPEPAKWCVERFGEPGAVVRGYDDERTLELDFDKLWLFTGVSFYFRNPDHAFEFKVRWV